jgi:hypothetical protein
MDYSSGLQELLTNIAGGSLRGNCESIMKAAKKIQFA